MIFVSYNWFGTAPGAFGSGNCFASLPAPRNDKDIKTITEAIKEFSEPGLIVIMNWIEIPTEKE